MVQQTQGTVLYVSGRKCVSELKMHVRNVSGCEQTDLYFLRWNKLKRTSRALKPDPDVIIGSFKRWHPQANGVAGSVSHARETLQRWCDSPGSIRLPILSLVTWQEGHLLGLVCWNIWWIPFCILKGINIIVSACFVPWKTVSDLPTKLASEMHQGLNEVTNLPKSFQNVWLAQLVSAIVISLERLDFDFNRGAMFTITDSLWKYARNATSGLDYNRVALLIAVAKRAGAITK